jgi:hypothetical protein
MAFQTPQRPAGFAEVTCQGSGPNHGQGVTADRSFRYQLAMRSQPWALPIIYVVVSLAVEAAWMVAGRLQVPQDNAILAPVVLTVPLQVPQDNAILAPVVLTVPPVLAAWICGYRRPKAWIIAAALLSVLTLGFTLLAGRLTGVSTGLVQPIIVRALAGFVAGGGWEFRDGLLAGVFLETGRILQALSAGWLLAIPRQ